MNDIEQLKNEFESILTNLKKLREEKRSVTKAFNKKYIYPWKAKYRAEQSKHVDFVRRLNELGLWEKVGRPITKKIT